MIATNEAVDVLRHGWQDAASTLAADVPEVAELLQARLEMAINTEKLDERNLLDTIQEVESLTSRAGSPSSQALARRLRRTVYEYLLALDAARPSETARASVDQPARAPGSPMVGAEEVAALGHAATARAAEGDPEEVEPSAVEPDAAAAPDRETPADVADASAALLGDEVEIVEEPAPGTAHARRRFALRRRQRAGAEAGAAEAETAGSETVALGADAPEAADAPDAQIETRDGRYQAAGEPALFESGMDVDDAPAAAEEAGAPDPAAEVEANDESAAPPDLADAVPEPADAEPASGEPDPGARADSGPGDGVTAATTGFVAPRAGFHIVEDAPAHRAAMPDEARLEMPTFSADEPAPGQAPLPAAELSAPDQGSQFLAWSPTAPEAAAPPAAAAQATASAELPTVAPDASASAEPQTLLVEAQAAQAAAIQPADDEDGEPRGWGVRRPGEAHSRRGGNASTAPPIEDDPFESNSRLADIRRRIEERLRKKRCDEAAALLQELAQEAGGRAVADLAMNAGDRCRALGKSNAALNCYLAAARSDPVYEMPLSRLADICIDNQDTELAVSYLERIARLYRYRGDDKAAIRVYRRIVTVAPYRDDVLALLMNAQRTGRLE